MSYVIEWEATALDKTKISEPGIVFKALNLASLLKKKEHSEQRTTPLISTDTRRILFEFSPDEQGGIAI